MPRARKDYHVATSVFPLVRLEKILSPVQRAEDVDPDKTYHLLGAHWYALGLYTKEIKPGSEIRASKLYLVREGDFVYNRLFAWKGAFAVANAENNGCYVSSEFPCFAIDEEWADAQYIAYYFRRAGVWNEALGLSSGSTPTSRNRLKEAQLLAMRIPLPPLDEQRRIVGRIEAVAAKLSEARGLRSVALEEVDAFVTSMHLALAGQRRVYLTEILRLEEEREEVQIGRQYRQVGVKGFGQGLFEKEDVDASQTTYKAFNRLYEGAIGIFSKSRGS